MHPRHAMNDQPEDLSIEDLRTATGGIAGGERAHMTVTGNLEALPARIVITDRG